MLKKTSSRVENLFKKNINFLKKTVFNFVKVVKEREIDCIGIGPK